MHNFYIPLTAFNIDLARIKYELAKYVKPKSGSYAITTAKDLANVDEYDFTQFRGITHANINGVRVFETGEQDTDLIFYPRCLQGSYLQEVEQSITAYLGLSSPRIRISKFIGGTSTHKSVYLDFHTDPHTPYRVHITLDVMPGVYWKFKTSEQEYKIHQPADGVPVLIEVAETAHAVDIPIGCHRYHIWFQYHTPVSNELLNRLLNN